MASTSARRHTSSQYGARGVDSATQPRLRLGSASGETTIESMPLARLNSCTGAGSRGSSPAYSVVSVQPAV